MLTEKQLTMWVDQLEAMLPELRKHYAELEDEQSAYNTVALFNIGKAIDSVTDAIIGLKGE
jgi:hypothetical protein